MKANTILDLVGNTPHLQVSKLFPNSEVWVKIERGNPAGSIKDRIALAMVRDAEKQGILRPDSVIVEPTSGNTGIALAMVGAALGYKVLLVMPESMSIERRRLMAAYGAELVLTPREKGMKGSIEKAQELVGETPGAWMPMQFENVANPAIHAATTAKEILVDFPEGFDYLITGVGTGGHISGVSKVLKEHFPNIKVVAVEPSDSPVISGGNPGPHAIQGIGAGFVPKNYDGALIDRVISISKDDAFEMVRKAAREEGLLLGISSGASLAAVGEILLEQPNARIITFAYDSGERYLSVEGLF
ncbi:cysteine synthase A [Williamwhitmania taraxaci]|uniref:Cysteine synthase n=1 Tax=Williamwhitmania taraxaci TaxID=1640674 RepID=A0A1G6MZJ1_9BACT|nr:cysteine synthase A [Williamwhitmania taraxaci]SDC60841.1 cysteine synthase [Williamwhitmania taraxaci]